MIAASRCGCRVGPELEPDQVEELLDRIDAERAGRDLVRDLGTLPDRDRALVELVDLAGLRPKEAAAVLGVTPGAARTGCPRPAAPSVSGKGHLITTGTSISRNGGEMGGGVLASPPAPSCISLPAPPTGGAGS